MKRNVLFFSRSDFTDLFGSLHKYLKDEINLIHVAYDDEEYNRLKNIYHVGDIIHFKLLYDQFYGKTVINEELLVKLDNLFLNNTDGRFNLNASIQSDRTFIHHSYEEVLQITACYYSVWHRLINDHQIDYFFHEPTSLMMNHMAYVLCHERGGRYVTNISVRGEAAYNFIFVEGDNGIPRQLAEKYRRISDTELIANQDRIDNYIKAFRGEDKVFFAQVYGKGSITFLQKMKLYTVHLRKSLGKFLGRNTKDRLRDPIEFFFNSQDFEKTRLKNLLEYKQVTFEQFNKENKYFFYPFHLEPEAVVLYWADGLYKNQVKLIENIAAQLPPGYFLYVKDHPHFVGYRSAADYVYLKNIPNIKLLAAGIPGKEIVKYSQGVVTINGTAGFEALMLNKPVYTFGNAFYSISKRVKYIRHIREFREAVYEGIHNNYADGPELYRFILALLESAHEGYIDYYQDTARKLGLDSDENIAKVADAYRNYILEDTNTVRK